MMTMFGGRSAACSVDPPRKSATRDIKARRNGSMALVPGGNPRRSYDSRSEIAANAIRPSGCDIAPVDDHTKRVGTFHTPTFRFSCNACNAPSEDRSRRWCEHRTLQLAHRGLAAKHQDPDLGVDHQLLGLEVTSERDRARLARPE